MEGDNKLKKLIWTSVTSGMESSLFDWIVSLRKVAYYSMEVLVLNYGANLTLLKSLLDRHNIKIIYINLDEKHQQFKSDILNNLLLMGDNEDVKLRTLFDKNTLSEDALKNDMVVNYRYMDIVDILAINYKGYLTAHFDVDMWFQDDIDVLFCLIEKTPGCVQTPSFDNNNKFNNRFVNITRLLTKDENIKQNIDNKINDIIIKYGAHLNGGFLAGKSEAVVKKLLPFKQGLLNGVWPNMRGSNQAYLNYSFGKEDYCEPAALYNTFPFKDPSPYKMKETGWINKRSRPDKKLAKVIHMLGDRYGFYSNNFFDTFLSSLREEKLYIVDNSKRLVWTSVTPGMELHLFEWLISLRDTAKYSGEILILNYGLDDKVLYNIKKYNVRVVTVDKKPRPEAYFDYHKTQLYTNKIQSKFVNKELLENDMVVNYRYIDILPFLKEDYKDYTTMHFDADIWFQWSIDDLFKIAATSKRCLFSPSTTKPHRIGEIVCALEQNGGIEVIRVPFIKTIFPHINGKELQDKFLSNLLFLYRNQGGFINGGFMGGKGENIYNFLKGFEYFLGDKIPNMRGADQSYINIHFDEKIDQINFWEYNIFSIKDKEAKLDLKTGLITKRGKNCVGIHVGEFKEMSFKHCYFDLFLKEIR